MTNPILELGDPSNPPVIALAEPPTVQVIDLDWDAQVTTDAGADMFVMTTPGVPPSVDVDWAPTIVEIGSGLPGPPGPPGPAGSAPEIYTLVNVGSWDHTHDFPYNPMVRLFTDVNEVEIGVQFPDEHTVHLVFPTPFTGTVYLS